MDTKNTKLKLSERLLLKLFNMLDDDRQTEVLKELEEEDMLWEENKESRKQEKISAMIICIIFGLVALFFGYLLHL
jgi:hypothetical protein